MTQDPGVGGARRMSSVCDAVRVRDRSGELRKLLNEWDFIGVLDHGGRAGEYDCMIEPLLLQLAAGADTAAIGQWLDAETAGHFGMVVDPASTRAMAERLAAWWQTDRDSRTG